MLPSLRTLGRILRIARTLRRYDILEPLESTPFAPSALRLLRIFPVEHKEGRLGQRLAQALTELGPSFIKFGQVLSTRADLLGDDVALDLADLQDRLPPFSTAEAKATIERELGRPVAELFASFEEQPVSAASIAQVHFAVLHPESSEPAGEEEGTGEGETEEGEAVAVKVLRPGIESAFEQDLELFRWLAELVERTQPRLRRFRPREVVEVFEDTVRIEMDLRLEAAALSEMAENFADDMTYRVPPVAWPQTSRRVLTMGRVAGTPMDDRDALLAEGHDLEAVLSKAAAIFFKQVFRDGFFHGDQHPGNMSVDSEGNILAVDFGIMGRLDYETRCHLADMLLATLERDYHGLAATYVKAGYLPAEANHATFAQALRSVCEPIAGRPLNEISFARLLGQLLQLTESYEMPVQPQLLLLQKNMLIAEGVSRKLDPGLNIWSLARPLIEDWIRDNRGPEARLRGGAQSLLASLERLPTTVSNLEKASTSLSKGEIRLSDDSVQALRSGNGRGVPLKWLAWGAAAVVVLALLLD